MVDKNGGGSISLFGRESVGVQKKQASIAAE
jgi:hypothetical protein